jgi:uncharacterized protein YuzE
LTHYPRDEDERIVVRITYYQSSNSAYIYFKDISPGGVAKSYPCDPLAVNGMINLDFDAQDRLIGIEVLDARGKLPSELLEIAEQHP